MESDSLKTGTSTAPAEKAGFRVRFPWPFVIFGGIGLVAVWLLSRERPDLNAVSSLRPGPLATTFGVALAAIALDALRLQLLARLGMAGLPFWEAVRIVLVYAFFSAVTPTSLGGEVSMVWLLKRNGLTSGAAAAVTGMRTLLPLVVCLLFLPVFAVTQPGEFKGFLHMALPAAGLMCAAVLIVFVLALVGRALLRRWLRHTQAPGQPQAAVREFLSQAGTWLKSMGRDSLNLVSAAFRRRPLVVAAAVLLTVAHVLAYLAIVPLCAAALGFRAPFWQTMAGAAVVELLVVFVPLPGGSGASETGIGALLRAFVPGTMLLWAVFTWRFIATHMRVLAGAVLTAVILHRVQSSAAEQTT